MSDKQRRGVKRGTTEDGSKKKRESSDSTSSQESKYSKRSYLARYTIRPSTSVSYTPRSVRFVRPVTEARKKSREPKRLSSNLNAAPFPSYSQRIQHEEYFELDNYSKKLASIVKSMTTSHPLRPSESILKAEKRRYSSLLSMPNRISDIDIIFRDDSDDHRRKIFKVPRTDWMHKLEEIALKNEQAAKHALLAQDDEVGDICCCPMFTTHLFFPSHYHAQNHFKLRPEKKGRKRTDK